MAEMYIKCVKSFYEDFLKCGTFISNDAMSGVCRFPVDRLAREQMREDYRKMGKVFYNDNTIAKVFSVVFIKEDQVDLAVVESYMVFMKSLQPVVDRFEEIKALIKSGKMEKNIVNMVEYKVYAYLTNSLKGHYNQLKAVKKSFETGEKLQKLPQFERTSVTLDYQQTLEQVKEEMDRMATEYAMKVALEDLE